MFNLPGRSVGDGGGGDGEDLGARPHPGESGGGGSGVITDVAPLLYSVAAHGLLQLLHFGHGEVPLLQP